MKLSVACSFALLGSAAAQSQTIYGQCAGIGYTGPTTCPHGWSCQYQNPWYSQCLPGGASTSSSPPSYSLAPPPPQTYSLAPPPPTSSSAPATYTHAPPPPASSSPSTYLLSSALVTTLKTSTSSAASSSSASPSPPSKPGSIPSTSGTSFVIDGKTQYFAGTNAYWMSFLTDNSDVDLVMGHLQSAGLKILRVWGFNDVSSVPGDGTVWFQSFVDGSSPSINTGADGLERLDYVVSSAASHDIKLIINFVNNWDNYGGIPLYMSYYNLATQEDWFTSSDAQDQYKAYIKAVVSRYPGNSAILAWELANEIRCSGCDTSVVTQWATGISAYIKSLDSSHLVTLGDEGWAPAAGDGSYPYTTTEGVDFVANLAIPDLDFGTFHMYPESWGVSDNADFPTQWIQTHGAACVAAGKPCLLEEYGDSTHSTEAAWQTTALGTQGIAADNFWQDGDTISTGQTANDGFTIYYGSSDWTQLVTDHIAAIASSPRG